MNKLEMRIISVIIREVSLFFMMHGLSDFDIHTEIRKDKILLTTKTKLLPVDLVEHVREKMDRPRELEIETYGWELIGDIDNKSELEIVGHLIDEVVLQSKNGNTVMTFIRQNHYKEKKER